MASTPTYILTVLAESDGVGIVSTERLESSTGDLAGPLTFAFYLHTLRSTSQAPSAGRPRPAFREIPIVQPLTKRQREILDYLNDFIQQHGYAPSLEEVGRRSGLSRFLLINLFKSL